MGRCVEKCHTCSLVVLHVENESTEGRNTAYVFPDWPVSAPAKHYRTYLAFNPLEHQTPVRRLTSGRLAYWNILDFVLFLSFHGCLLFIHVQYLRIKAWILFLLPKDYAFKGIVFVKFTCLNWTSENACKCFLVVRGVCFCFAFVIESFLVWLKWFCPVEH